MLINFNEMDVSQIFNDLCNNDHLFFYELFIERSLSDFTKRNPVTHTRQSLFQKKNLKPVFL